ncbi:MAG: hypothetical protein ACI97A_001408 [Planctomycetota bacterium]|jgi:hypothetical protein
MNRPLIKISIAALATIMLLMTLGCQEKTKARETAATSSAPSNEGAGESTSQPANPTEANKSSSNDSNRSKSFTSIKAATPATQVTKKPTPIVPTKQPDQVKFRYCIIGQFGSANPVGRERSAAQAKELAGILELRLRRGDSRTKIIQDVTAENLGSIGFGETTYLNFGVLGADPSKRIYPRESRPLVAETAFRLQVGQVATVPFAPQDIKSLGTWVIQRLK